MGRGVPGVTVPPISVTAGHTCAVNKKRPGCHLKCLGCNPLINTPTILSLVTLLRTRGGGEGYKENRGMLFTLAQKSLTIKTSASSYFVLLLLASTAAALQVLGSPVFQSCFMASSHTDRTTKVMIGVFEV